MHPFLSPENFKKTLRCFHVSRAQRKGELGTNALILERMSFTISLRIIKFNKKDTKTSP